MEEQRQDTVPGTVDYKHRPAIRSKHGRWISASILIWLEMSESIAFNGVSGNLINFLMDNLGQTTAMAATNVNAWKGMGYMLPILGASIADTFLGQYYTILASSIFYILGLGLLTLSTAIPSFDKSGSPERSQMIQKIVFFVGLYLVAVGRGGRSPCIQAFGADQFDGDDPQERNAKRSFFNWWNFGLSTGAFLGLGVLSYVQDNLSWSLGFGIPCSIMLINSAIFLLGTMLYRYPLKSQGETPFTRIGRVFVRAAQNRNNIIVDEFPLPAQKTRHQQPQQFRFLDKALLVPDNDAACTCSVSDVEEAKAILRLCPIWAISFLFAIVYAQTGTLFIKQGDTLNRMIGSRFEVPSASLLCVMFLTMLTLVPIYDYVLVPTLRRLTGKPAGITMLQRVGIGLFITVFTMIVSAMVEKKRLEVALRHGLLDSPTTSLPMRIWWLLPQYVLFGITSLFTLIGLQEFFYDQVPNDLRSVGVALYSTVLGLGFFLCSFLVEFVAKATKLGGRRSWISDNLNRSHLDYFYWLLAVLSIIDFLLFIYFAKSYQYNTKKQGSVIT